MLYRGMQARACVTKSCVAQILRAEQRRQDAFNQYSMAKQRLAQIEQERCGRGPMSRLTAEIDLTDRQIADNERELDTTESILSTLPVTRARFAETASKDPNQIGYLIVRQTPNGPVKIESSGMTVLQPGDLVDIVIGAGDSAERSQPDRNGPASKPNREGPIERASRQEIGNATLRAD